MPHLKSKTPRPHKWRNSFNNADFPCSAEISFLPSETRPDEVMSMREIEDRYAKGRSILDVLPRPVWDQNDIEPDFDDYLPDIRNLDHADRMELLEQTQYELEEIKARANALADKRKAEKAAQRLKDEEAQAERMAAILAAKNGSGSNPDA